MKQSPFTEEQLTQALHSLRPDASDELFRTLTKESPQRRLRPLLWYSAAAALVAIFVTAAILLWPQKEEEQPAVVIVNPEPQKEIVVEPVNNPPVLVSETPKPRKRRTRRPVHAEPDASAPVFNDLSQLLTQADADETEAQKQREQMDDIISQYIALVEP